MADIIQFGKSKKPNKKKGPNPFRIIAAFIALLFISLSLVPFLILCIITLPLMNKKYYQRLSDPINEMNSALMDVMRMIQGEEKDDTKDR